MDPSWEELDNFAELLKSDAEKYSAELLAKGLLVTYSIYRREEEKDICEIVEIKDANTNQNLIHHEFLVSSFVLVIFVRSYWRWLAGH